MLDYLKFAKRFIDSCRLIVYFRYLRLIVNIVNIEINMETSNEVKVKNEPICDSQSIPETREAKRQSNKVKNEPIDIEIQTSKSQIEVKTEEEVVSIGFLNEEYEKTSLENNEATTSNSEPNKPDSK